MKKLALVFLLAVFIPSLVLAWLAVRSLRDQQMVLERQQSLLYQGVADALAREADDFVISQQREFGQHVENLLAKSPWAAGATPEFDDRLRAIWPEAEVGFVVTTDGVLACPEPTSTPAARTFYAENGKFVCSVQPAEVYWDNTKSQGNNSSFLASNYPTSAPNFANNSSLKSMRKVAPQTQNAASPEDNQAYSKVASSEAEFRQLVGNSTEGTLARFLQNKLNVLTWYRSPRDTRYIFGAQLSVPRLKEGLRPIVGKLDPALRNDIDVALLDENARPVAVSRNDFQANWKRPFVATELGEGLPHWEMAVYLLNPAKLAESARALKLTLGLFIGVLLLAIIVGGWLIVADLNRQLKLARQKTDFVSNVSHELKTPLTSIRMFSELLAEGRVADPEKRQSYLHIITAEAARLTRLINNVLDFSRMERGEKKYNFQPCDLSALVKETMDAYRPHLEANGFKLQSDSSDLSISVKGDRDALAQVIVNLLSNAEKYSNGSKEITVQVETLQEPLPHVDIRIMDRGPGVPRGCEEKIFEQFYRAHDSLSSGIQGSGLGLTLARQIARAHGGDVTYQLRTGGGSCFTLRLPVDSSGLSTTA